jgi:hypothetical protein
MGSHALRTAKAAWTRGRVRTYRCKFAVDIADQKGAELGKDLEAGWLAVSQQVWYGRCAAACCATAQQGDVPESRAGCTTWSGLDICQISRCKGCYRVDIGVAKQVWAGRCRREAGCRKVVAVGTSSSLGSEMIAAGMGDQRGPAAANGRPPKVSERQNCVQASSVH